MAIKQTHSLDTGFSGNHWEFISGKVHKIEKYIEVFYGLWKDSAAKTIGRGHSTEHRFMWENVPTSDLDSDDNVIFDNRYNDFMATCNNEPTESLIELEILKATHFDLFLQSGTQVENA